MKPEEPAITSIASGFHGYVTATFEPPKGYGFGVSYYATVWALVGHPLKGFQVGLPSTWIQPNNFDFKHPLCPKGKAARDDADAGVPDYVVQAETYFRSVFQNIEGGVGYWSSDTQAPTNAPKYRINGVPDCYSTSIGSPGWPFGKTEVLAADAMGLAQLSNRIVIPPDGIPFAEGSEGKQLGIAWMALPLTDYDGYFLLQTQKSADQDEADDEADPPRDKKMSCLQRGTSGGILKSIDKKSGPDVNQLWTLVTSKKKGYFHLETLGNEAPADFDGNTLWKLVPTIERYYYLESAKDKNKCLGGDGIVKMVPRSDDATKRWTLVPRAVKRNRAGKEEVEIPTGDSSWTLFFNAENFKGPVAFFPPKTWSRISKDNPEAAGRGLDARMAVLPPPGMEFNTVPGKKVRYKGDTYLRIPKLLFPTEKDGTELITPLMRDMMLYSREAIYAPVMSWFAGGPAASGAFGDKGAIANRFVKKADAIDFKLEGNELKGISDLVEVKNLGDSNTCSWGLSWKEPSSGFTKGQFPEYFVNGEAKPEIPIETGLSAAEFDYPDIGEMRAYKSPLMSWQGTMFDKPKKPTGGPGKEGDKEGDDVWKYPGPISPVDYTSISLADASEVRVVWYKFIDQPALQKLELTADQKNQLQSRVELLHKTWNIEGNSMKKPSIGALVSVDPKLIVTPPEGYEAGYVPIVVYQSPSYKVYWGPVPPFSDPSRPQAGLEGV